jgi:hypothetical protein
MASDQTNLQKDTSLRIQAGTALARMTAGDSPSLTDILNRSLIQIRSNSSLKKRQRIGDFELLDPDFQLVCIWADELNMPPEEVLKRLLQLPNRDSHWKHPTSLVDGKFETLFIDRQLLPILRFPPIRGLSIKVLKIQSGIESAINRIRKIENPNKFAQTDCGMLELNLIEANELETLDCSANELSFLDLSSAPNLKNLDCSYNNIASLDLISVPKLASLDCSGNMLIDIDLTSVQYLVVLECKQNNIRDLNLSCLPNLEVLVCSENILTDLDLASNDRLVGVDCSQNQLAILNLDPVPHLSVLDCDSNKLSSLNLSSVTSLTTLNCSNNLLAKLDIRPVVKLESLEHSPDTRLIQRPDQYFE